MAADYSSYDAGTATLTVEPELARDWERRLRNQLDRSTFTHSIQIDPDLTGFQTRIDAALSAVPASMDVQINPDFTGFSERVNAELATIGGVDVTVGLDGDFDEFERQFEAWSAAQDFRVEVGVDFDPGNTARQIDRLTRRRTVEIDVNTSGGRGVGSIASGADDAEKKLRAMSLVKFGALTSGIAAASGAILGLVGVAGGAVASLGALAGVGVLGAQGLGDAFTATTAATASAGQDAEARTEAIAAATDNLAAAQKGLSDAQTGATDAQRDALDAQDRLNDAYREAGRELRDMNDQLASQELSQEGAAIAVARARENLARVKADPTSSGLDIQEADLRVREAEQRYKTSKTETADLRVDVSEANAAGVGGSDRVQAAQRGVEQANRGVTEANYQLEQATKAVTDAERELAKAGTEASSSQQALADALAKLSPNARDFYEKMVALGPAWKELRLAVQDTMFDGLGDAVTTLADEQLPNLKTGLSGLAAGLNGGIKTTLTELSSTFTELWDTGTMQEFVSSTSQAMQGLAPLISGVVVAFTEMGARTGPAVGELFASLGESLRILGPALGDIGAAMAGTLAEFLPVFSQFAADLSVALVPVVEALGPLLNSLVGALTPLIDPLAEIGTLVADVLTQALAALTPAIGPLAEAFSSILSAVAPLLPALAQVVSALVQALAPAVITIVDAFAPLVTIFIDAVMPIFEALTPVVAQLAGIIADVLVVAVDALTPIFEAIVPVIAEFAALFGDVLGDVLTAFAPVLTQVITILGEFLQAALLPILPVISDLANTLFPILADLLIDLAPVFSELATAVGEVLEQLAPFLGEIAEILADVLVQAVEALAPLIPPLAEAFVEVVKALLPLVPVLMDIVLELLPPLIDIFVALLPIIEPVIGIVTELVKVFASVVDFLLPFLIPAIQFLGEVVETVFEVVGDVIEFAINEVVVPTLELLEDAVAGLGDFFSDLGDTVEVIWDNIVNIIAVAVGAIGELIKELNFPDWVPLVGGKGLKTLGESMVNWSEANKLAYGGPVSGPGGPRDDVIPALLSNGEYVINAASTAEYRPLIEAINDGSLPKYADGGIVQGGATLTSPIQRSMWDAIRAQFPDVVLTSGTRYADVGSGFDNHMGERAIDLAGPNMPGYARWIYGLNSSQPVEELIHAPLDGWENLKKGAPLDYGAATDQQHYDHVHWAMADVLGAISAPPMEPQAPGATFDRRVKGVNDQSALDSKTDALANSGTAGTAGSAASAVGSASSWSQLAGGIADAVVSGYVSDTLGVFGIPDGLPPIVKAAQTVAGQMQSGSTAGTDPAATAPAVSSAAVQESVTESSTVDPFAHTYDPAGGVDQWRGVVEAVFGLGGWDLANVDRTLDQMDIESDGNPKAQNNDDVNAQNGTPSGGLMQVILPTFNAFRSPQLADNLFDPAANIFAAVNYVETDPKFNGAGLAGVWPTTAGYADGGSVWGMGTGTSDSILARLSNGEFVVNAESAEANRPMLEAINADKNALDGLGRQGFFEAPFRMESRGSSSSTSDNSMTVNLTTPDVDTAFSKAKAWDAQRQLTFVGR
ncbi:transglycosylase SLT domain-containing protein [Rhodococcus sp. NPDC003994]